MLFIIGTTDKVTITDWFNSASSQVETIKTGELGEVLYAADVNSLISQMAGFAAQGDPSAVQTSQLPERDYRVVVNSVRHAST